MSDEIKRIEREVAESKGYILHPAGGLTEDFVYEPINTREYVYKTRQGQKQITKMRMEYEDPEHQKKPHFYIMVEGRRYDFEPLPPKEWLFKMPDKNTIEKWVQEEKESLTLEALWNLNSVYLRTFLDYPHEHEFSVTLLFIEQSWLAEILPVVFYLGVKGEFGGGKTVTGEAVTYVCRHGYLTGNLSPSFVARAIERQKITLMVDELDTIAGTQDSDLNSIFRQGYRRGLKYSRVNPNTLETESYHIFGPKLFTVHSDAEEALQTRTIPIHVRETSKVEYPIVNLDKEAFSRLVYTENFFWYIDNIMHIRDNEMHIINELTSQLDKLDILDPLVTRGNLERVAETAQKIREKLYEEKRRVCSDRQVSQVSQVTGRNIELMYVCFALSNLIGIDCDDDVVKTFQQKIIEEGERLELGYLGILREILVTLWKEKRENKDYLTEDGYVKISNKELYDRYIESLKKAYGQGVSPTKFKGYILDFGFTDALNRKKLEVPLPDDPKAKSRLCNIFTDRVLRKLGIEITDATKEPSGRFCEFCGKKPGRLHLIPGEGEKWICDECLRDYPGNV